MAYACKELAAVDANGASSSDALADIKHKFSTNVSVTTWNNSNFPSNLNNLKVWGKVWSARKEEKM